MKKIGQSKNNARYRVKAKESASQTSVIEKVETLPAVNESPELTPSNLPALQPATSSNSPTVKAPGSSSCSPLVAACSPSHQPARGGLLRLPAPILSNVVGIGSTSSPHFSSSNSSSRPSSDLEVDFHELVAAAAIATRTGIAAAEPKGKVSAHGESEMKKGKRSSKTENNTRSIRAEIKQLEAKLSVAMSSAAPSVGSPRRLSFTAPSALSFTCANDSTESLADSAKSLTSSNFSVRAMRQRVFELYSQFILKDPKAAASKNAVARCFHVAHREMEPWMNKAKNHEISSSMTQRQLIHQELTNAAVYEARFKLHTLIEEHRGRTQQLMNELQSKYADVLGPLEKLSEECMIDDQYVKDRECGNEKEFEGFKPKTTAAAVRHLLATLHICLGDLERYSIVYGTNPRLSDSGSASGWSSPAGSEAASAHQTVLSGPAVWSNCVLHYVRALEMSPGIGRAHNQLAVISTRLEDEFETLYHYVRALNACPFPFHGARENILTLYERNRNTFFSVIGTSWSLSKRSTNANAVNSSLPVFLIQFVRLLGMAHTKIDAENFQKLAEEIFQSLSRLIQTIDETLMTKISILLITQLLMMTQRDRKGCEQSFSPHMSDSHSPLLAALLPLPQPFPSNAGSLASPSSPHQNKPARSSTAFADFSSSMTRYLVSLALQIFRQLLVVLNTHYEDWLHLPSLLCFFLLLKEYPSLLDSDNPFGDIESVRMELAITANQFVQHARNSSSESKFSLARLRILKGFALYELSAFNVSSLNALTEQVFQLFDCVLHRHSLEATSHQSQRFRYSAFPLRLIPLEIELELKSIEEEKLRKTCAKEEFERNKQQQQLHNKKIQKLRPSKRRHYEKILTHKLNGSNVDSGSNSLNDTENKSNPFEDSKALGDASLLSYEELWSLLNVKLLERFMLEDTHRLHHICSLSDLASAAKLSASTQQELENIFFWLSHPFHGINEDDADSDDQRAEITVCYTSLFCPNNAQQPIIATKIIGGAMEIRVSSDDVKQFYEMFERNSAAFSDVINFLNDFDETATHYPEDKDEEQEADDNDQRAHVEEETEEVILFQPPSSGHTAAHSLAQAEVLSSAHVQTLFNVPRVLLAPSTSSSVASTSIANDSAGASLPALIILDVANIAMRYGNNTNFGTKGIELAFRYFDDFASRNFREFSSSIVNSSSSASASTAASAVSGPACQTGRSSALKVYGFLPEYYFDFDYVAAKIRQRKIGLQVQAAKVPDNIPLLYCFRDSGRLVMTPAQDYDDSYAIHYALKKFSEGAQVFLVSNDQYRDHVAYVAHEENVLAARRRRLWLRQHVVSFAFAGDDFILNPQFDLLSRITKKRQGRTVHTPSHNRTTGTKPQTLQSTTANHNDKIDRSSYWRRAAPEIEDHGGTHKQKRAKKKQTQKLPKQKKLAQLSGNDHAAFGAVT